MLKSCIINVDIIRNHNIYVNYISTTSSNWITTSCCIDLHSSLPNCTTQDLNMFLPLAKTIISIIWNDFYSTMVVLICILLIICCLLLHAFFRLPPMHRKGKQYYKSEHRVKNIKMICIILIQLQRKACNEITWICHCDSVMLYALFYLLFIPFSKSITVVIVVIVIIINNLDHALPTCLSTRFDHSVNIITTRCICPGTILCFFPSIW